MTRQRWIQLAAGAAALAVGAVVGFVIFSDTATGPGVSTQVSTPAAQGIRLAPGFQNQVPVAVIEGEVVEASVERLTISVASIVWESAESREELDSVWPVVGETLPVALSGVEIESEAAIEGKSILVLLNNRGIDGDWLVQLVAAVDGESVSVVSDSTGRVNEQLAYIASQVDESLYETFIRTAAELRAFKDATIANGGDEPKDKPPTVEALQDFDRGATRAARADARWQEADPKARDYDDAPDTIRDAASEVHIRFNVNEGFLAADSRDSIVTIRDGVGVGFAFRAAIGTIEEEQIPATPGRDLQIVIGPVGDLEGTVVAAIPSRDWESAAIIDVTISGTPDDPIANWSTEPAP